MVAALLSRLGTVQAPTQSTTPLLSDSVGQRSSPVAPATSHDEPQSRRRRGSSHVHVGIYDPPKPAYLNGAALRSHRLNCWNKRLTVCESAQARVAYLRIFPIRAPIQR